MCHEHACSFCLLRNSKMLLRVLMLSKLKPISLLALFGMLSHVSYVEPHDAQLDAQHVPT